MRLTDIYVRFYRSFNYDYIRKAHPKARADPWDDQTRGWFPFVRIPIEADITTVVGANESGKSQLLSAIRSALFQKTLDQGDFCRYSQFFAVNQEMNYPEFGAVFTHLTEAELARLGALCDIDDNAAVQKMAVFRTSGDVCTVHLLTERTTPTSEVPTASELPQWDTYVLSDSASLAAMLPLIFEIDSDVPLPSSVPVAYLASGNIGDVTDRKKRLHFMADFDGLAARLIGGQGAAVGQEMAETASADNVQTKMMKLADDLLVRISGVDRSAYIQIREAIAASKEGFAQGIVDRINAQIDRALNLTSWWSQDTKFRLLINLRDNDLVFTIQDRTGTDYTFDERSNGLKYFLSYYVQYLAHQSSSGERAELLLMDEPDAYLSMRGQQDLLKIFEGFAFPVDEARKPCQVVYVTHSPFLLDKNHAERIRVIQKGDGEEGTRVVKSVARNHYEPLRTTFGNFVAETTFISNCNLMLEGASDQIYLAGMSSLLRQRGTARTQNLDLNSITLVPTASASHIPYMVFLARGRDVEQPAIIVLLDGDEAGNEARRDLENAGPRGRRVLDDKFVFQLPQLGNVEAGARGGEAPVDIEDLVPVPVGLEAMKRYASEFYAPDQAARVRELTVGDLTNLVSDGLHLGLETAARAVAQGFKLDKVGLSRAVLEIARDPGDLTEPVEAALVNFKMLFAQLNRLQRMALLELDAERETTRINRIRTNFFKDHPSACTREEALLLLEHIEEQLNESLEADMLRQELLQFRKYYELDDDIQRQISDFGEFRSALQSLAYTGQLAAERTDTSEMTHAGSNPEPVALEDVGTGATESKGPEVIPAGESAQSPPTKNATEGTAQAGTPAGAGSK